MALTQDNINQALDQVVNNFTNKHIAMPNGKYQNECTAPITWYLQWLGLPWDLNMHNNRADGWGVSPPYQLTPFFSFEDYNPNRGYPRGTILMWDSPHIAIVLADNPSDNTVVCFEQNADPDGSACGTHTRILKNQFHACTHAMVPIIEVPVSAPAGPPYSITQVDPYKRDVLAGHQKWNLDQPNFDAVANNPILTLNQQTTITVAAELHHHHPTLQQYLYLLEDPNVPQGYNQLDTVAYVVPAPPYVPPAAPVPVKLAPKVELVTEVPYYENSTNAKTGYQPNEIKLPVGTYYQISTDFGMWNLSSDNMKDLQHWVNPKDNVVKEVAKPLPQPVEVPTPQSSIGIQPWFNRVEWFNEQHMPVPYLTTRDTTIKDYSGTRPEVYPLSIGHELKVYGTIIDNMGIKYYLSKLPNSDAEFLYRYAVPMVDPESGRALLLKKATKPIRNRDHVSVIASELEELGLQFIDFVPRYWKRLETKITKKG